MPELPEVETIVRRLNPLVSGREILSISVLKDKSFQGEVDSVVGRTIERVSRRAKLLEFRLDTGASLLAHLKMTGQFIFVDSRHRVGGGHPTADWIQDLPSAHTRVWFELAGGARLFFNDQRIFGWIKLMNRDEIAQVYAKLGPDITSDEVTTSFVLPKIARRTQAIKQVIMDNALFCGVGNIYACDALHLAQISPFRRANSLTENEVTRLIDACKSVIGLGIELGGATISDFRTVEGFSGSYQDKVRVYKREGQPCLTCGATIEKTKLGGRGTFFCPGCQA